MLEEEGRKGKEREEKEFCFKVGNAAFQMRGQGTGDRGEGGNEK